MKRNMDEKIIFFIFFGFFGGCIFLAWRLARADWQPIRGQGSRGPYFIRDVNMISVVTRQPMGSASSRSAGRITGIGSADKKNASRKVQKLAK
jgi:hypothetical protein